MNKTNAVPMEVIEAFLSAIDKIDPFGRQDVGMTPQQYRRYRGGIALQAAIASTNRKETSPEPLTKEG